MGLQKEEMSVRQMHELLGWAKRLSRDEYQKRRSVLQKVTDPQAKLSAELVHPFLTPLHKGLRLKTEGPECLKLIDIGNLDFLTGDVLQRDMAGTWRTSTGCFSQHHAEHLFLRKEELPRFDNGAQIVFPGTVYVSVNGSPIEFYATLACCDTFLKIGVIACRVAFQSNCRFPYQLHTCR